MQITRSSLETAVGPSDDEYAAAPDLPEGER